jgi:hypothetical protein
MAINGTIKNINSQCQIIWFQWKSDLFPVASPINDSAEANAFDLSNHLIDSCTFSKNIGSPAGNFTFRLDASRDWKDLIKPGSWALIYMANDGSLRLPEEGSELPPPPTNLSDYRGNLRAICYIERVSTTGSIDDKGSLDISYEVSGRDYGVIYEETDLWYNYFVYDEMKIQGLTALMDRKEFNTAADQLEVVHKLFLAPQLILPSEALGPNNSLSSIGQQWLLPKQLGDALNLDFQGSGTFYGQIKGLFDFKKTLVTSLIDTPMKFINGKAWEKLKGLSCQGLHELFPELDDTGHPRLVFRPIPWGINQKGYPRLATEGIVPLYYDLAQSTNLTIEDSIEVVNFNLGEDNHNRYNHYLVEIENDLITMQSTVNILNNRASQAGRQFPFMDQLSVQRHGLRAMHLKINSLPEKLISGSQNKDGFPNADLLLQYNEVLFDYWQNSVTFESGTITIIGRPEVRVGKVLNFGSDIPHNSNKVFYIEAYSDDYTIDEHGSTMWTQTLQVTRGVEKADLQKLTGFGTRDSENPPHTGEYTHRG